MHACMRAYAENSTTLSSNQEHCHARMLCLLYLLSGSSRQEHSASKRFSIVSCSSASAGSRDLKPARHTSSVSMPLAELSNRWLASLPWQQWR